MTQEVQRNYLEINSIRDLNKVIEPSGDCSLNLLEPINFQLNKFFYKNIGKKHKWIDRLAWTENQWIDYVSNKNVETYVFKLKTDLAGFFELISHSEKKEVEIAKPNFDYSLNLLKPTNFQLNKFFYKNIGKKHKWIDRLVWTETQWIDYVSNEKVETYIFKYKDDLVGFFELISHSEKKEVEIAYFGLLEEFQNKKLGSYLLSEAIKKSFKESIDRVWVHTCSLDHKNALNNYISRGMKIFKTETINI